MSSSTAGAHAFNAGVQSDGVDIVQVPRTQAQQDYLDTYADDCERAVDTIEKKLAGMKASLEAAKSEAERARAEAQSQEV